MVNERIVLTPVLDVFSPIYKMKNTAEDDLQEEVIEGQNGAVVLAKITFIEKRELLCLQDQDTGESFISCLLYTSPSPRDATLSRMPSSA